MSLAFRKERDILATPKQGEVGLQSVQIRSICVFRVLLKNGTPMRRIQRIITDFFLQNIRAKSVQSVFSVCDFPLHYLTNPHD